MALGATSVKLTSPTDEQMVVRRDNVISKARILINTFKCHVFAPMGRFQLELIYLYFPPSFHLTVCCFCPVGLSLLQQHFQQVLWVLKLLQ